MRMAASAGRLRASGPWPGPPAAGAPPSPGRAAGRANQPGSIRSRRSTLRTSKSSSPSGSPRNASTISRPIGGLVDRSDSASTLAWLYLRAIRAVSASTHSAARAPSTLFAAIEAPVPDQQQTTPRSAAPSATRRATAALASTHSSSPPGGRPVQLHLVTGLAQCRHDLVGQRGDLVRSDRDAHAPLVSQE